MKMGDEICTPIKLDTVFRGQAFQGYVQRVIKMLRFFAKDELWLGG